MTEPLEVSEQMRCYAIKVFFENFGAQEFASLPAPVLSLLSTGKQTGLVIDSGYRPKTDICPVIDAQVDIAALKSTEVSGKHLTEFLKKNLEEKGCIGISDRVVDDIKHKLCYVALDFDNEMQNCEQGHLTKTYELPDA